MSKHKKQQYVQAEPKKEKLGFFTKILVFVGIISALNAILIFSSGYIKFQTQWDQTEWPVITAQVVKVAEPEGEDQSSAQTEVQYQYQVEGSVYSGSTSQTQEELQVGDSISVRYNPDHPESSTTTMRPDMTFLVQTTVFSVLAIVCIYGPTVYGKRKERTQHRLPLR